MMRRPGFARDLQVRWDPARDGDASVTALPRVYYDERKPALLLRATVAAYWELRAETSLSAPVLPAIAPDGAVSLVFDRLAGRLAVIGPRTVPGAFVVHPGDCWWGVRFWPGAGPGVLGPVSLETVRNRTVWADETPLDAWRARLLAALTAATTADEARTIWDQAIARQLAAADAIDRDVLTAARLIVRARGDVTVREVIAATGISPRQLRRRFLAAAGLTPKELIRTRRIRASLLDAVAAEAPSWSEIAAARGFSDQSHLVREVRRAIGITPAALHPYLRRVTYGGIVDY